ncbi:MAG: gamma-glutamyltransferase [Caldilineaceae bacterium]|nr:gamma-glutamyltransferase [Caldilineaceae bacterium]
MEKGAISAGDPQTAAAGAEILEQGGNAVDAAVAAAFTSFVAETTLVNISGGGIALVIDSQSERDVVFDFFSDMPRGAYTPAADFRQIMIDFGPEQQAFQIGRASVAVPGAVAGLCRMAQVYGTFDLPALLAPAIRLAQAGTVMNEAQHYIYMLLQPIFQATPGIAAIYAPGDRLYQPGERIPLPALGRTLEELARRGPDYFYCGELGQAIVSDQQAHGGLVTAADMAAYEVYEHTPIALDYREHTVMLPPPSSSGGVLVAFALKLMAGQEPAAFAHNGVEHLRLLSEIMRLTNLARADWDALTGPVDERIAWFLSDEHLNRYHSRLNDLLVGAPAPVEPSFVPGPEDTTHISVVDGAGLLVSITTSAGENAGYVVGDTGVCLNNMLGEADLHPQGFHRWPPGTRLNTMMTPTVVVKDKHPVLAVGSGGSNRIRSAILQVLSNVIDFDLPVDAAVNASRIHFEAGLLQAEGGISQAAIDGLRARGYVVNQWPDRNMFFGGAHAVGFQAGRLVPAGDVRRGGSVALVQ